MFYINKLYGSELFAGSSRISEDIQATASLEFGAVSAFFDSGVTASVDCAFREFDLDSIHVPGGNPDATNTLNSYAFSIPTPVTTPGTAGSLFGPSVDTSATSASSWTITCKLPPGTGINYIGMIQQ